VQCGLDEWLASPIRLVAASVPADDRREDSRRDVLARPPSPGCHPAQIEHYGVELHLGRVPRLRERAHLLVADAAASPGGERLVVQHAGESGTKDFLRP
jgi:hypothetical protein